VPKRTDCGRDAAVRFISALTLYDRFRDWFALLCVLLTTLSLVASAVPAMSKRAETD